MNRYSSYALKPPTIPIPFGQAAEGGRGRAAGERPDEGAARSPPGRRLARSSSLTATSATSARMLGRRLPPSGSTASMSRAPARWRWRCAASVSHAAVGAGRRAPHQRPAGGRRVGRSKVHLPGQQSPTFYAKQVLASVVRYGAEPVAAVLRQADGLRRQGDDRLRPPRPPGRAVLPQVAARAAVLQALPARRCSATTCATPTSNSATC